MVMAMAERLGYEKKDEEGTNWTMLGLGLHSLKARQDKTYLLRSRHSVYSCHQSLLQAKLIVDHLRHPVRRVHVCQ